MHVGKVVQSGEANCRIRVEVTNSREDNRRVHVNPYRSDLETEGITLDYFGQVSMEHCGPCLRRGTRANCAREELPLRETHETNSNKRRRGEPIQVRSK